ncbi:uncharacterized protein LOC117296450 [Asterias rubens]|uniref:uncharacterized protein LOC117296450 n=1 Tax=Asterias rubens TaxID=7604 RepID=UPI001455C919|nr:uncharacterized protein LOC117296450 [Asterias rubens]
MCLSYICVRGNINRLIRMGRPTKKSTDTAQTSTKRKASGKSDEEPKKKTKKSTSDADKKPTETAKKEAKTTSGPTAFEEEVRQREGYTAPMPKRNKKGECIFEDCPDIYPNMTPAEILQAGSFGGTYYRPIKSGVTGEKYSGVWKELPQDWLEGINIAKKVSAATYNTEVNTYKVKCGGDLNMWESSGWMRKQDPYGWFQWYCRFYLGRRSDDDERQIGRWSRCAGFKGRWRNNLIAKCVHSGNAYDNFGVSPVVRQTLQHWGYRLNKEDFDKGAKRVK